MSSNTRSPSWICKAAPQAGARGLCQYYQSIGNTDHMRFRLWPGLQLRAAAAAHCSPTSPAPHPTRLSSVAEACITPRNRGRYDQQPLAGATSSALQHTHVSPTHQQPTPPLLPPPPPVGRLVLRRGRSAGWRHWALRPQYTCSLQGQSHSTCMQNIKVYASFIQC